jgi:hypothetical protein
MAMLTATRIPNVPDATRPTVVAAIYGLSESRRGDSNPGPLHYE